MQSQIRWQEAGRQPLLPEAAVTAQLSQGRGAGGQVEAAGALNLNPSYQREGEV